MKKVFLISLFTLFCFPGFTQDKSEINILFLGNSFTFRHDLPTLVKTVIEEGQPQMEVKTEKVVYGGQDMYRHTQFYFSQSFLQEDITEELIQYRIQKMEEFLELENAPDDKTWDAYWENCSWQWKPSEYIDIKKNIEQAIKKQTRLKRQFAAKEAKKWDYVVLQSWLDTKCVDAGYVKYAKELVEIAKSQGTEVILYFTAPYIQNSSPVDEPVKQDRVEQEVTVALAASKELDVQKVVHVPTAINNIQQGGTKLIFCYENDFHPNQYTAYLTANMFYAALFGESTEGFDFDTVTETKLKDGKDPDGGNPTVKMKKKTKLYLQEAAFKAVNDFNTKFR